MGRQHKLKWDKVPLLSSPNDFCANIFPDHEVFADNVHSCEYYEIDNMKSNILKHKDGFSTYVHNIRSINCQWDDVSDIIDSAQPLKFSRIMKY